MITPILSQEAAFEFFTGTPVSEASDSDSNKTEDALLACARAVYLDDATRAKLVSLGLVELVANINSLENAISANDWSLENL